jgi:hypothetical protein
MVLKPIAGLLWICSDKRRRTDIKTKYRLPIYGIHPLQPLSPQFMPAHANQGKPGLKST